MILAVTMLWFTCLVKVPTSIHTMRPSASELPLTARYSRGVPILAIVIVYFMFTLAVIEMMVVTLRHTPTEFP